MSDNIVEEFMDISTIKSKHNIDSDPDDSNCWKSGDTLFSYAKEVLSFGLLYNELVDAVHESDSLRVLRWWRFMMLIFKSTDRVNYSIKILYR